MRKRIVLLVGLFAASGLLFAGWQNATAATLTNTEDFEDDTVGSYPTESWYTFNTGRVDGTIAVANNVTGNTLYASVPAATSNATVGYITHVSPTNFTYINWSVYVPSGVTKYNNLDFYIFDTDHNDYICSIRFNLNNQIVYNDGTTATFLMTYSAGNWYDLSVELDYTNNKAQATVDSGIETNSSGWLQFYNGGSHSQASGLKLSLFQNDNAAARDVHVDDIVFAYYTESNDPPTADFTYSVDGKTVNFIDNSTDSDGNITAWQWDFDDDGVIDSTDQNPTYNYSSYGTYNVTLTITDDGGATDSVTKTITLTSPSSFDAITDLVMSIMPFFVVLAMFGAITSYLTKLKL